MCGSTASLHISHISRDDTPLKYQVNRPDFPLLFHELHKYRIFSPNDAFFDRPKKLKDGKTQKSLKNQGFRKFHIFSLKPTENKLEMPNWNCKNSKYIQKRPDKLREFLIN